MVDGGLFFVSCSLLCFHFVAYIPLCIDGVRISSFKWSFSLWYMYSTSLYATLSLGRLDFCVDISLTPLITA
jgi:hypothetical protein